MSVAWHPTPARMISVQTRVKAFTGYLHRSTTLRSTLLFALTRSSNRVALTLSPQSGLAFGFEPLETVSKTIWLMEQMSSLSEEVIPQAPRAGE